MHLPLNMSQLLSAASLCVTAFAANATVIEYQATDLADVVPGSDRWRYEYRVTGSSFLRDFGFDILFPVSYGYQFGDLEAAPTAPNVEWNPISIQPDPVLPSDGRYEPIALVDNASLADRFVVEFIWRGAGAPGSQPFEIFDPTLTITEVGQTIALRDDPGRVPAPGSLILLAAAGVSALALRVGRQASNLRSKHQGGLRLAGASPRSTP